MTRERQELYRRRVPIPDAVGNNVPRAFGPNPAASQNATPAQTQSTAASSEVLRQNLMLAAVFFLIALLAFRRLAPGIFDNTKERYNPWALDPATARNVSVKVRAEEEAFAAFLAEFHVGPSASSRTAAPAEEAADKDFYARAAKLLVTQRKLLLNIGREADDHVRRKMLTSLRRELCLLKDEADFPEVLLVWQVASALEGLLKQLTDKTGNVTASTLRTIAGGVDLLDNLCVPGLKPDLLTGHPLRFLAVDDDLISRHAVSLSLKKALSQPDLAVNGEAAFALTTKQTYDVIFLDVQMPGMDGFALCSRIHETVFNRNTPVVFVTGQSDFNARAQSTLSGGSDLMGKPFLTFEITVKALTLALQGRIHGREKNFLQKPERSADVASPSQKIADSGNLIEPRPVVGPTVSVRPVSIPVATLSDEALDAFLARASAQLETLRNLCHSIFQTADEEARQSMLADGFLRIHSLTLNVYPAEAHPAFQLSAALERLFRKLLENPKNSTTSTLTTVTTAVDLLADLCVPGLQVDLAVNPPIQILVVDDDLVARRAITGALQMAFEKPEGAESGDAALALAAEKAYDVIFMDVQMPGMDGFAACAKIRETVPNRATPVVFVTGQNDFKARAQMNRSGGSDLIGKPFLTAEITVKALTFALRGRLQTLKTSG